jgi:hypothetical protein
MGLKRRRRWLMAPWCTRVGEGAILLIDLPLREVTFAVEGFSRR